MKPGPREESYASHMPAGAASSLRIETYVHASKPVWDDFVRNSKNGTFLFFRDYMDYHQDRFRDHSLIVILPNGGPVALLPANRIDDTLMSHAGLTYGGFITNGRMRSVLMLEVFDQAVKFLGKQGIRRIVYKTVPHIYHQSPAEEDRYALFKLGGVLVRQDVLSVVKPSQGITLQKRRARAVKNAQAEGVRVEASDDYESFWEVLEQNLADAHGVRPVHTLPEIRRLRDSFPNSIKLYAAYLERQLIAGTVIYETPTVAHAQYIANSEIGRSCGALDLVFYRLLTGIYEDKAYFDFGISTDNEGSHLNIGLVEFKEGFGARSIAHDFFELQIV